MNRVGCVTAPLVKNVGAYDRTHPFSDPLTHHSFTAFGRWNCEPGRCDSDLVAEYIEPSQTTVTHGGPYVAVEVYDRLRQAAEVVVKAAKINNRDFIQHLSGVDSTIVKLRAALVALGDVLREIG